MISVIIPVCNEGENIRRFAGELLPPPQALPVPFEVEVPVILSTRQFGISKLRTVHEIKNHLVMLGKIIKWKITNKL